MSLWSDITSAIGSVFGNSNSAPAQDPNDPLKKNQNNTSLPTTNLAPQKINMPVSLQAPAPNLRPVALPNIPISQPTIPLAPAPQLPTSSQGNPLTINQVTHSPAANFVGGVAKFIPQFSSDFSNFFANLGNKLAGGKDQTIQQNEGGSPLTNDILKMDAATGKNLQLAGDTAQVATSALAPGFDNLVTDLAGKVLPDATPAIIQKLVPRIGGNAVVGSVFNAENTAGQGGTTKQILKSTIPGAIVGGALGGASGILPDKIPATADDTAPTTTTPPEVTPPETIPAESGTKAPTEPAPTNAPAGETAEPTPAPGATESGIKPTETPPPAPTVAPPLSTLDKVNALPTQETPPIEATPTPAPIASEQAAVQDALDKTAQNVPKPVAPPETATPAITPEQAASDALAAKEAPTEQVVSNETKNPLKSDKPANPYDINPVEGLSDEEAAKGPSESKMPDRAKFTSPKAQLTRSGAAGRQILQLFRNKEFNEGRLTTAMENETPGFHDLSPKDQELAADVVRGTKTSDRPDINNAAQELKSHFSNVEQASEASGVPVEHRENYIPQMLKSDFFDKKANIKQLIQNLMNKGDTEEIATKRVNTYVSNLRSRPNIAGHLELPREFENPQPFHSKELRAYNEQAASRISEAQHYGPKNEELNKLTAKAAANGEDVNQLNKIVEDYMHPKAVDKGTLSKLATGVRAVTNVALLPKAALSHTFQGLQNTASDTGFTNYFKALGNKVFNSDEKDFINKSGIKNISTQERSVLDKATAPGLKQLRSFHQQVAVLAGKYHAESLAKANDVTGLREAGVTGDLKTVPTRGGGQRIELTDTQKLQAGKVESDKSIFSDSSLETSKALQGNTGKAVGQFRTAYTAKQGGRIVDLVKQARNGDVAPLLRYLAVGVPVGGVGTLALKNLYKTGNPNPFPSGTSVKNDVLNAAQDSGVESVGFGAPESAINAVRYNYNNNDRINNAAGAVSPVASIATEAGQNIDQALRGNDKPLIKQGAGYIPLPVIGSKIDQKYAPTKPITLADQKYFNAYNPAYTKMINAINPFNKSATNQNTAVTNEIKSLTSNDHNAQGQMIQLSPAETQAKWTTVAGLPPSAQNAYIDFNKSLPNHSPAYDLTGNGTIIDKNGNQSDTSKFQVYATYEKELPGSAERSQLEAMNPWLTQTFQAEQNLYNSSGYKSTSVPYNGPLPGGLTQQDLQYPNISPATNDLMTEVTKLSSILPADRTPDQEAQLKTIENNPDLRNAYSALDTYTNNQRVARGAPPLKLAPNASPAVQAGINAYDALPPSKSSGNTDPATNGERSAWIKANPALYAQMSNYYASSDMATIASQGAKDELQGNAPSQSLLGAIKSAGTNDIASSKNPNGTTNYTIDPAAAYAQSGSSGSSYTSKSAAAYERDKAAGIPDSMRDKTVINEKNPKGLTADLAKKYKAPKLLQDKAPTGKNGNPFVQSITDTKGVTMGKGNNIFGHAISHVKSVKAA